MSGTLSSFAVVTLPLAQALCLAANTCAPCTYV